MRENRDRRVPFTEAQRSQIRSVGRPRTWRGGGVLLLKGGVPDSVILIDNGLAKITFDARNGHTSLLAFRGPGELVGEMACLDGRARSATVIAKGEVRGTVVAADRFLGLLEQDGRLALSVVRSITARLRHADGLRADQGALPAGNRVARVLLDLAARHGTEHRRYPRARAVLVSQAELAAAAGTSRESVVRTLRLLQESEVVTTARGRIFVHDMEVLGHWSGH